MTQLSELVVGLADQVAASCAVAEASAKVNAEKVISQAAAWSASRINEAGDAAVNRINDELQQVLTNAAGTIKVVKWAAIVAAVCSVAALAAVASVIVSMVL